MSQDLLTIQQAAEKLGVSTKTIRRWETEGKIESLRTSGGHRRFRLKEIGQPTLYTKKQLILCLLLTSLITALTSITITRFIYSTQLNRLSSQLETLINQTAGSQNTFSGQDNGVAVISPQDNGQLFIKTSHITQNSSVSITPVDQTIQLEVKQIFPGLGFIVTGPQDIQTATYFNWQITQK